MQTVAHNRPQADTEKHKRGAKSYILLFAGVCTMYMYLNMYMYLYLNMNLYMYMYMYMYLNLYMMSAGAPFATSYTKTEIKKNVSDFLKNA